MFEREWSHTNNKIAIFTDCQIAIRLIKGEYAATTKNFWHSAAAARNKISQLAQRGFEVKHTWAPVHCGFSLNELAMADQAANRARENQEQAPLPPTRTPIGVLKAYTKARVLQWIAQIWWETTVNSKERRGRKMHRFHPQFWATAEMVQHLSEVPGHRTRAAMERIRMGNATLNRHLHKMGSHHSPHCDHCPGIEDQVEHRIFQCPAYEQHRRTLYAEIQRAGGTSTLDTLVNYAGVNPENKTDLTKAFGTFLKSSGLDSLFVWNPRSHLS
jgi:hypothetical protein